MKLRLRTFLTPLLLLSVSFITAQDLKVLDSTQIATIDSLFIDRDLTNYSLRVFTNYKNLSFWFRDGAEEVRYIPNNRSGIGIGVATSKLLIDIAFNIKAGEDNPTRRFDMRINYKPNNNYFEFLFQRYRGYNVELPDGSSRFRPDLVSLNTVFNYLYLFNEKEYQVSPLRNVISRGFGTYFSYGLGGFAMLYDQKAESTLLEPGIYAGRESDGIESIFGYGAGVLVGIGGFFSMGNNLYSSITVNGGLGVMENEVRSPVGGKLKHGPLLYQLSGSAVLGYVREKFYLNLNLGVGYFSAEVSPRLNQILHAAQAKIAVGFNIFKEKKKKK